MTAKNLIPNNWFRPLLLVALAIALVNCSKVDNPKIAAESTRLADSLSVPLATANPVENGSKRQRVFIDSSYSMSGFVGANPSARTAFDEFIDLMPDVLAGCEVYRYGQAERADQPINNPEEIISRAEFDSGLHDPSLYRRAFNPDDVLIKHLVSQKSPELSIILTDGVESDHAGQVNTVVVDSIKSWMGAGNLFAILILKSRFSGPFYSERQRRMIGKVTADDRPFYAFVLGTSRHEFDDLIEKIRRRFSQVQVVLFADDAVNCKIEMPIDSSADYQNEGPPNKPYYWQMLKDDLRTGAGSQTGNSNTDSGNANAGTPESKPTPDRSSIYSFRFEVRKTYPIKNLGVRLTAAEHRWDPAQKTFQQEPSTPPAAINAVNGSQTSEGGSRIQIFTVAPNAIIRSASDDNYGFYAVGSSVYVKDLADEIANLSTRDDSTSETANKTYRFQELVQALLDVHLKERIQPRSLRRLYVTITRL